LSNDTMEGKLVANAMESVAEKDGLHPDEIQKLRNRIESFNDIIDGLGFCFSEERDLLSQWRGYAANATGVAIAFSRLYLLSRCGALMSAAGNNVIFTTTRVEYNPDRHESLVKETYEKIKPYIKDGAFRPPMRTLLSIGDPEFEKKSSVHSALHRSLSDELLSLVWLLFRLKSPALKEEREVRLCSFLIKNDPPCEHRAVQDRLIAYRPFKLSLENNPITEVILGPKHVTPPKTVKEFLKGNGYGDVPVERSKASYR